MLNDRFVREHPEIVRAGLRRRGDATTATLDAWLAADARRRALAAERDTAASARRESQTRDGDFSAARRELAEVEAEARTLMLQLPNPPADDVPEGVGSHANVEMRRGGAPPVFTFTPAPHWELARALGIFDAAGATKLAGPRFPLLLGMGARLARALATLMLDHHTARGYIEVAPPYLVRAATLVGSGHLPHFSGEMYRIAGEDLTLSPTAETQLIGLHAGETLPEERLPLAYASWAPAFRREAGSAGRTTHGLLRQHQFEKVELVRVVTPETAATAFQTLVADAEAVVLALGLPYRIVALCAGELPFSSARTWDIEVWMPSQPAYVEVSSISDCGTFQARRSRLRYRPAGARPRYPHTLNGTGLAIGRTLAALLENGQRADGSVALPPALHAYVGADALTP
ncbi:MAG TPA: serine--tRNA ligase [Ktedonobacterales bacterium]